MRCDYYFKMYYLHEAIKRLLFTTERAFFRESGCNQGEGPRAAARIAMANQPTVCEPDDRAAVVNCVATLSADLAMVARRSGLQTFG
jgi:hypothetical protein